MQSIAVTARDSLTFAITEIVCEAPQGEFIMADQNRMKQFL
jgi:hypothetical protein